MRFGIGLLKPIGFCLLKQQKHHWLLSATIEGFGVGCLVPKFDEITPTLASLHGLQVKYRVLFEILLLVYKAVHGLASLVYVTCLLTNTVMITL